MPFLQFFILLQEGAQTAKDIFIPKDFKLGEISRKKALSNVSFL